MQKKSIRLQSCRKQYTHDQDKFCSPEQTVTRFKERLKETGLDILKEVKRIDTGRLDIPVYFSVCGEEASAVIGNKKQMGKGSTPEQSQASACMELAERYSFFSFIRNDDNFLVGDYAEMISMGYPVLDQKILLASVHDHSLTPEVFDRLLHGLPMQWTWATRLSDNASVLIPFSWFYAINEFNGPSAGNTFEEAVLQGVSELIERHVCALVSRDKLATPAIDQNSIQEPVARELIQKFRSQGIELYLNDFTLDTGIPTVAALAWDPKTFPDKSEIVYTAGTTPDPNKALIRALTEVAQLAGDFETGSNYVASGLPKPLSLDEVEHVVHPDKTTTVEEMVCLADDDMFVEIQQYLQAVRKMGSDIYLINTMHPLLQIPAIYTIIPGAHFRERAMGGSASLFAAKLATQLLEGSILEDKLKDMQNYIKDSYYLAFYRGKFAYEQGDCSLALDLFTQSLALSPNQEDIPYIYSYLGCCQRDLEQFDLAIENIQQGLSYDEERPDMHNILGVCYFKTDQYEKAVQHFRRAVVLNPVSAIDHANLALNLEKTGQLEEAIEEYQVALGLDPHIAFALERLETLLMNRAERGEA
ncbi:YcaO-like family protein [Desulfogranum japonicum]|uniref:YcaO-like family protein n=1 Tax=Desulfogranum japonicum TaxID=231447 RepID=UPI0003F4D68D|nr:YcaO-like family protein [Desulfogranum japonicum]